MALNKMILYGRLVRDAKFNSLQNGLDIANFTLAWSEKIKENERKLFIDCVAYGNEAQTVNKYFKKGDAFIVVGKLNSNNYTDSNGVKRYSMQLRVGEVHFVNSKAEREQERETSQYNNVANDYDSIEDSFVPQDVDDDDEDLPF